MDFFAQLSVRCEQVSVQKKSPDFSGIKSFWQDVFWGGL